jgi:hypothetical protein
MTTQKMDDLAQAWCEMWNEDPTLARRLVTEDFRVWFGSTANGDDLRGPGGLERFVARSRAERGVRFTPRVVVADDGGERFAYSWDARFPDGTVHTGADAYTLRGGLIAENWSVVGDRPSTLQPSTMEPMPDGGPSAETAELERVAQAWSPMWNGETELTAELLTDDFRIWFAATRSAADDLAGPAGLADYVTRFRAAWPGLTFGKHRELIVDSARQRVAFTWTGTVPPDRSVGGIDLFQFRAGRICQAWSWTGGLPLTF